MVNIPQRDGHHPLNYPYNKCVFWLSSLQNHTSSVLRDDSSLFYYYTFCSSKLHKYQGKQVIYIKVYVMLSIDLCFSLTMSSTQRWPEQGWALLHLLLVASFTHAKDQVCRQREDHENPQLDKDGDIVLGGLFSFHTNWKERENAYIEKPLPLQCTR